LVRDFSQANGGMLLAECSFVRYNLGFVFEGMAFGNHLTYRRVLVR
jgi:hypothetical protein